MVWGEVNHEGVREILVVVEGSCALHGGRVWLEILTELGKRGQAAPPMRWGRCWVRGPGWMAWRPPRGRGGWRLAEVELTAPGQQA